MGLIRSRGLLALIAACNWFPLGATALITVGALDTPHSAYDVEVVGDLAYVAASPPGLRVIDVSNPAFPVQLGAVGTAGSAYDVEVVGNLAYVAAGWFSYPDRTSGSLRIIDVSNPAVPVEIGAFDTPDYALDVEVVGDLAYVAASSVGLRVIDISNPGFPVELGALDTGYAWDVQVLGDLAYVADYRSGLRVIDISNPALPVEVGALDTPGYAIGVAVVGDLAYVADGSAGLRVIDVSDPAAPVEIGALGIGAVEVAVVGELAYVAARSGWLRVIDVSNPGLPVEIGALDTPGSAYDVEVVGDLAYVPGSLSGRDRTSTGWLRVIDVSNPGFPVELGARDTGEAREVEVVDGLAFVADEEFGLRVIDVSNPKRPRVIGGLHTPGEAREVEVAGDLAYLVDQGFGLRVIDVSNPALPVEIGAFGMQGCTDVAVVGDLAYVAGGRLDEWGDPVSGWLRVIDVSDPAFPVEIGALDTLHGARDVEVVGNLAYLAGSDVSVIDVSNPAFPVEVGFFDTDTETGWGVACDVEVVGDLAYLAGYESWYHHPGMILEGWLRVIDVSDPAFPVEVGSIVMPDYNYGNSAYDVEVVGHLAYVAASHAGLRVIDVSNPTFPVEVGAFDTPGSAHDVEVVGDLAYVTDYRSELRVIDFGPEYAPKIPIDLDIKPGSDPNSINPDDEGVVPAAILGSDTFDVAEVDATTLAFGPAGAAPAHYHGPHIEDVNNDGLMDLLAHYPTVEAGIVFGTLMACVNGETLDGKAFNGCDAVRTVPDMDGDKLLDTEEANLGTNPLSRDTDGDGFSDGNEVLVLRTDPLNARDPTPAQTQRGRGGRRLR